MPNKLEQLEFKLENIIGIQKHAGKFRKLWGVFVNCYGTGPTKIGSILKNKVS